MLKEETLLILITIRFGLYKNVYRTICLALYNKLSPAHTIMYELQKT